MITKIMNHAPDLAPVSYAKLNYTLTGMIVQIVLAYILLELHTKFRISGSAVTVSCS